MNQKQHNFLQYYYNKMYLVVSYMHTVSFVVDRQHYRQEKGVKDSNTVSPVVTLTLAQPLQ